jgi:hypothetical protein
VNDQDLAEMERRRLRALVNADLGVADELHADDFQLIIELKPVSFHLTGSEISGGALGRA